MSVGQSKGIRARQGKANGAMQRTDRILADRWRDLEVKIDGTPLPVLDFHLPVPGPDLDDPYLLTTYSVTNQVIKVEDELTMTDEQQEELSKWWADRMQEEFIRQMTGGSGPSEYQHSLRAAGAKV
ncbi:hypothetical protein [Bradyrhizobium sp. DASA03007]|uniref:hypothetical protein n=1 Tax=unclassified Bradyrhizobium TaxID=2631580 RepID=UPI003F702AF4